MRISFELAGKRVIGSCLFLMVAISTVSAQNMFRKVNDFDGDGKSDFAVVRNEGGYKVWYLWQSTEGFAVRQFGLATDVVAAGDYDGDGKTDLGVFRGPTGFPSLHQFYALESSTGNLAFTEFSTFGSFGSFPMQQDYNGDGTTDFAVWLGQFTQTTQVWIRYTVVGGGIQTTIPPSNAALRLGDMNGDGRAEIAHHPNSNNVVTIKDLVTNETDIVQFGLPGDQYVTADFDGDAIGDLAIFRPSTGTWWWIRSSDNVVNAAKWGQNGDIPVPGDYDGDGLTDLATYRPGSQSTYWVSHSSGGMTVIDWGISSDTPVRY